MSLSKILLLAVIFFLMPFGSLSQASTKNDSLLALIHKRKADTTKVLLLDELCQLYGEQLLYDSAYVQAKMGLAVAEKIHFKRGIVIHLINSAGVLVRKQNQTKALVQLFKAYEIAQAEGYLLEESKCLTGISFAYTSFNDYQEAIRYKIKHSLLLERLLSNKAYRKEHLETLNKDSLNAALSISTLSFYYIKLNEPKLAFKYGFLGLDKTQQIAQKDATYMAYPLNCIGIAHRLSNHPDSALHYYRKSIEQSLKSQNKKKKITNLYKSYWEIAIVYQDKQWLDSSIYYAERAESLCKSLKWDKDLIEIQLLLAENYTTIDPVRSIDYYKQAVQLKDSIYSKEKEEHLKNITFNEHERQAELLELKRLEEINRRNRIQYSLIALGIFMFVLIVLVTSKKLQTSDKTNAFLTTLALLMVFEFINLIAGPYINLITSDYPALSFATAIVCSFLLFPFEAQFERWLVKNMRKKG